VPFWLKLSLVILLGIAIGVWFAGEAAYRLNSRYYLDTVRGDMERITALLAGLVAEPVITGDRQETEYILRQYAAGWSDFTYIHIMDDRGFAVAEWQSRPIKFGPGIRKYERVIEHGGEEFGILSVYIDLGPVFEAIEHQVSTIRRQSALVLLSIIMFIIFFINFFALRDEQGKGNGNGG